MRDAEIRPAGPGDIAAITRIYADAVAHGTATFEIEPPDAAEMARRQQALLASGLPYLVAEQAGAVAGYAYAGYYHARPAYRWTVEDTIYVAPAFHRRGLGRLLMTRLIVEAEARGFRQMIAVIGDFGERRIDCVARGSRFPPDRNAAIRRLQARPLARYRADATPARQCRRDAAVSTGRHLRGHCGRLVRSPSSAAKAARQSATDTRMTHVPMASSKRPNSSGARACAARAGAPRSPVRSP